MTLALWLAGGAPCPHYNNVANGIWLNKVLLGKMLQALQVMEKGVVSHPGRARLQSSWWRLKPRPDELNSFITDLIGPHAALLRT